ncbi:hypothetical protein CU254_01855 [Amycolatopsis sp. AA4]|uniref:hypothetical protein n=1 Tax=Actinomycetes TaxID=1760 RepID=UPI0001B57F90|nr:MULTISPECIES: hypothetical protein [Actinomycetes]ATY09359.1 hypothetical protein CU254_01855 [Amycolatopsis sp. AA4]EFL04687.1 predicted protein [Streptomyces sp. AA4]
MTDLLGPWFIVGGYALSFGLLWLANWLEARRAARAAICYALSGIAFSLTSLYWLSAGTASSVPLFGWIAFPLVVTALLSWRGWHQRNWINRLDSAGEPTFGFLPHHGRAVALAHPDPWPRRTTVEFAHQGHRLLGMEYSTPSPFRNETFEQLGKVSEELDSINAVVALRVPEVPALTISPNTRAFEPDFFTPLEDARIVRNQFGWLRPDTTLHSFEVDPEFDRRFSVSTSDPEFAAAVLTGECREMIMHDLWFRVHQVAFCGNALWTTDAGGLTEDRMFGNSRRLAMLAATVPAPVWEVWGGDRDFPDVATRSDTSYDAWFGKRGGFVRTPVNRRREAADRQPVTSISLTMRSLLALGLLAIGIGPAVNASAAMTGLAPHVQLTVATMSEGGTQHCFSAAGDYRCVTDQPSVRGTVSQDGTTRQITIGWVGDLPRKGDTVEVSLGPLWGDIAYQADGPSSAPTDLLMALVWLVPGLYLAKRTYLPRPPRRVRKMRKTLATA